MIFCEKHHWDSKEDDLQESQIPLTYCKINTWRGGRVVECDGLENRCARKCTVGSNPTLSAK